VAIKCCKKAEQLAQLLLEAKLQEQGDLKELAEAAFLFEMLTRLLGWVENNPV
jgi:hypothetical protein